MTQTIYLVPLLALFTSCHREAEQVLSHEETTRKILENQEHIASHTTIGALGIDSLLIAVGLIFLLGGLATLVYRQNKVKWDSFWNYLERHLTHFFIITWLFGFTVYLVGTSIIPEEAGMWGCVWRLCCQSPMAVVHAFEMFVLESDVSAIHSEFHGSLLFMSCFSLAHFLAIFVSTMFIIKYFGFNIVAKLKLFYVSRFGGSIDDLYVFWGMNEATYCLTRDIQNTYREGKKNGTYEIVIINIAEEDEEEEKKEHTAVERLFSFLSFKREELSKLKELGCLTINVFKQLNKIKTGDGEQKMDIIGKEMDTTSLARLINNTLNKVHFFLLGNAEDENIIGTAMLCRDQAIEQYQKSGHKVQIYCHARYDSINRIIEDKFSHDGIEVKVLDSSHDSINILKSKQDYHPINCVDIDTEDNLGTVKSDFTALVVGFGETGMDATRFLYEYGAFVDSCSSKEDDLPGMSESEIEKHAVKRSGFKCYVIDKDANKMKGGFLANAPAISNIHFINTDVFTPEFYDTLKTVSKDLNYVVLALGNDDLNITTAARLFTYVRKHRPETTMENLKIFVRCHSHEQRKRLQHIADHYNECACSDLEKEHEHIIIFGTEDQLYTYEQVIENDFANEGRQYNALYCEASGENGPKNQWESRHQILLSKKTLDAISELRRKESQDIANAYHALTKLYIMNKVVKDKDGNVKPEMRGIYDCLEEMRFPPKFARKDGIVVADERFTEQEQLLFRNIARLEHFRWNAAHEAMGYQSYAKGDPYNTLVPDKDDKRHGCNETFKLHNCLIDWQELDAEMNDPKNEWHPDYKLYDFVVVTTTFMMQSKHRR